MLSNDDEYFQSNAICFFPCLEGYDMARKSYFSIFSAIELKGIKLSESNGLKLTFP